MANKIPLIVSIDDSQIQELPLGDNLDIGGGEIVNVSGITTSDLVITGNVTANYFLGDGSQLTNLPAGNYSNANVANYLPVYGGNIRAGNILALGEVIMGSFTSAGNVSGQYIIGNGSLLTSINAANISGNIAYATTSSTSGTVTTNAQPNITSVGTLTSLTSSGNIIADYFIGGGQYLTNIPAANVTGTVANATYATNSGTATTATSATTAVTITSNAQPNITSVGTLTSLAVTGNTSSGNFIGNGQYLSSITGGNITGTVANATSATTAGTVTTNAQPNITSVGTLTSLTVTGNTSSGNFIGNGQYLTNIPYANVTGAYGNANVAAYLPTYTGNVGGANAVITGTIYANTFSAPNGTFTILSNLDVKGNVTYIESNVVTINDVNITLANNASNAAQADGGGFTINGANASFTFSAATNNFVSTQSISTNGNVTAGYFIGNGSVLSSITGSNVTGTVANATSATTAVTITSNAQPNITSVGTLTSLTVTGNVSANYFIGNGSTLSSITGSNVTGTVANATFATSAGTATSATTAGTVTTNAQANITSVGTLTSLTVTGNVSGGNLTTTGLISATGNVSANYFIGNGSTLSSITGSNVTGTVPTATTAGTVTTNAQANITSVGTLTSLTVTGNVSGGNITTSGVLTVNSGNATTAIVNGGSNGVGNIGSSTTYFNTIFAKATSAQYADLAENYLADGEYPVGTVLSFGGDQEVTISDVYADTAIAGVVSGEPAYIMNAGLIGDYPTTIALMGRVPCFVEGSVKKGDLMVSAGNGRAKAMVNPPVGSVIGKSLQSFDGDIGIIEVVVGRI